MANFKKKTIQDTEGGNFGNYDEGVGGGGSPKPKNPLHRAPGVNSNHRQENNDTMQPRTDDGKFTYKSVNGKSINPKYGPSRGKTVNPLLTGGENGVMIEDVEKDFANQSGAYWKKYKDKWYQTGSEKVSLSAGKKHKESLHTKVAGESIWNVAKRRYDSVKGEFEGESQVFNESKSGSRTLDEKSAHQKAQATGEEQYVTDSKTGGIKLKPGTQLTKPTSTTNPISGSTVTQTPVASVTGVGTQQTTANTVTASDIANADYTPIYSDDEISQARAALQEAGLPDEDLIAFDNLSPKEKDEYIQKHFSQEDEEETTAEPTETTETTSEPSSDKKLETKEKDSDAVKKIKDMGFNGDDDE